MQRSGKSRTLSYFFWFLLFLLSVGCAHQEGGEVRASGQQEAVQRDIFIIKGTPAQKCPSQPNLFLLNKTYSKIDPKELTPPSPEAPVRFEESRPCLLRSPSPDEK